MRLFQLFLAATLISCGVSSDVAFAQQASGKATGKNAPATPPKPGDKFGEWTYQCDSLPKDAPKDAHPACYVSQARVSTNERGEQTRVLLVNLSKVGAERQPALFVFLPFGVAVQQDVAVTVESSNIGLQGRVDTCLPAGCRVPFLLQREAQDLLRKNKTLWVSFAPIGGKNVRVEVPLDGFGAALAAIK